MPTIAELEARVRSSTHRYLEFLRVPALSAGVYVLPAGGDDAQQPHGEDELYYVVRGRARLRRGDDDIPVGPGDALFVAARVPHRFHDIAEELVLLVVFGPAEGSVGPPGTAPVGPAA